MKEEETRIEVDPEIIEGYYKQGIVYYSQGKYQEAIIEWKKVLALDPTHEKAQKNIKKAQEKLGMTDSRWLCSHRGVVWEVLTRD